MWPFTKKSIKQPKFCFRCGCKIEVDWVEYHSPRFDTETGVGTIKKTEIYYCPNWKTDFDYRHYYKESGNTKEEEIISECA